MLNAARRKDGAETGSSHAQVSIACRDQNSSYILWQIQTPFGFQDAFPSASNVES